MIIGSSNSALNVEEEAEKSVKVQTREEIKNTWRECQILAYSDHFSSRPYGKQNVVLKNSKDKQTKKKRRRNVYLKKALE